MPIRYKYRLPLDEDYRVAWIKLAIYAAIAAFLLLFGRRFIGPKLWDGIVLIFLFHAGLMAMDSLGMMLQGKVSPDRPAFINFLLPMQEPVGGLMMVDLIVLIYLAVNVFKLIF